MDTQVHPKLTFDQAALELTAVGNAVATTLSQQAAAGDAAAWAIADLYRKGIRQNGEAPEAAAAARTEFLGRYEVWRERFAELVAPIAHGLGNPLPAPSDTPGGPVSAEEAGQDPFGTLEVAQPSPKAPQAAPAPAVASEPASPRGGGKRKTFSQADIAKLTLRMTQGGLGPEWTPAARAQVFVTEVRPDFTVDEVLAKAAELELIEDSARSAVYEPTEEDKRHLRVFLLASMLPQHITETNTRIALFKAALVELKEIIKDLSA